LGVGNPAGGSVPRRTTPRANFVMKRNRKREPLRFGTVTKSLFVCVCIAISGLCYVWQKNVIYRLGDEIKKREALLSSAQKRNLMLAAQVAHLESPAELETKCQEYNLSLVAPKESQVVRLYEPGPEWDVQMANAPLPARTPVRQQVKLQLRIPQSRVVAQ
jgi:cell division protein FtsL